jgi:hypothetical protein
MILKKNLKYNVIMGFLPISFILLSLQVLQDDEPISSLNDYARLRIEEIPKEELQIDDTQKRLHIVHFHKDYGIGTFPTINSTSHLFRFKTYIFFHSATPQQPVLPSSPARRNGHQIQTPHRHSLRFV